MFPIPNARAPPFKIFDSIALDGYIGQIEAKEQATVDRALSVSMGLGAAKEEILDLILCPRCKSDFEKSGRFLVKRGWQDVNQSCDVCQVGKGCEYGVFGGRVCV